MDVPLLQQQIPEHTCSSAEVPAKFSHSREAWSILSLSAPVSAAELLSYGSTVVSTAYVGDLGSEALSAWTLARSIFHVSGLAIVTGLASGQTTFSGQAFGAGRYSALGVQMQRVTLLALLLAAVSTSAWLFGGELIMQYMGQAPVLVGPAAACLRIMAPSLFLRAIQIPIKNYFACQGVVVPQTIVCLKLLAVTPAVNAMMINRLQYGLQGAAYAYNILTVIEVGMLVVCVFAHHMYLKRTDLKRCTWSTFAFFQAASGWGSYLRIALPSCAMVCLNWWCYEVMVFIAGLGRGAKIQLGAMGILFSTHALGFMMASGFGVAVATRVSNELGAKQPAAALRAMRMACLLGAVTATVVGVMLAIFSEQWALLYAQDAAVVSTVVKCMPLLSLSLLFDSFNVTLSGVLRGCGLQMWGFLVNLGTFWAAGLPLAAFLALPFGRDLAVYGIWLALVVISALQAGVLLIVAACLNFKKLVLFAQAIIASERQRTQGEAWTEEFEPNTGLLYEDNVLEDQAQRLDML